MLNHSLLRKSVLVIFLVLLLDQTLKIWIKTHMMLGQEFHIFGNWFIVHFTENEGMAFGMHFGGAYGKLFLSLFRIVAVAGIGYYLWTLIQKKASTGLVICISLIFAGATGNILDSIFYGIIFNDSYFQVAQLFPAGGGYAGFLHGKVVDMLYFPILQGNYPNWLPIWGGEDFQFFRPVFNIADSSITTGVLSLIVFQSHFFRKTENRQEPDPEQPDNDSGSDEN